tara:strand:+ start:480444 stop:480974 length:531 start_codon:yes stop_codon:yes gene_type:complete
MEADSVQADLAEADLVASDLIVPVHEPIRSSDECPNANMFRTRSAKRLDRSVRRGVAVVELAICLPILALILIATTEACVMLQLQHNLAITAYEGARIGIIPGTNSTAVEAQCSMLLDDRNINDYTITMLPSDPTTLDVGDAFTVTVSADCDANTVLASMFFEGRQLNESVVMLAE